MTRSIVVLANTTGYSRVTQRLFYANGRVEPQSSTMAGHFKDETPPTEEALVARLLELGMEEHRGERPNERWTLAEVAAFIDDVVVFQINERGVHGPFRGLLSTEATIDDDGKVVWV